LTQDLLVSHFSGDQCIVTPSQLRWSPFDLPSDSEKVDFIQGLKTVAGAGEPSCRSGLAVHVYTANTDMNKSAFYNSDGDMLIGKEEYNR
jgi:homogentisate 1,2-dioxygenase